MTHEKTQGTFQCKPGKWYEARSKKILRFKGFSHLPLALYPSPGITGALSFTRNEATEEKCDITARREVRGKRQEPRNISPLASRLMPRT